MRPKQTLRKSRPVQLGVGALMLAIPASAVALTAGQADTQSVIRINIQPRHTAYGRQLTVTGNGPSGTGGRSVQLQFEPKGASTWRQLATTAVRPGGRFRFSIPARKSGLLRVVPVGGSSTPGSGNVSPADTSPMLPVGGAAITPSAATPVFVRASFRVPGRELDALAGQPVHLRGKLLPAVPGRRVRLLTRSGRRWISLATARTGGRGGFDLRYNGTSAGQHWLRVGFGGDRLNGGSWAHAGRVIVFRQSVASWYTDGGGTACGFHAYYGVAHRTLPCGTKVTFRAGGRTVTAVVDDRGPFVGGREWDLNQNTAAALGFGGVGTVWSSI